MRDSGGRRRYNAEAREASPERREYGEGECLWLWKLLRRNLLLRRAGLLLQVSGLSAKPRPRAPAWGRGPFGA